LTDRHISFAYIDQFVSAAKAARMLAGLPSGVYSYPVQPARYPEGSVVRR